MPSDLGNAAILVAISARSSVPHPSVAANARASVSLPKSTSTWGISSIIVALKGGTSLMKGADRFRQ